MDLSIVIPCFNEESLIEELLRRVIQAASETCPQSFEIIMVDDGSSDGTWELIQKSVRCTPELSGIKLSRNFGHQYALRAGLEYSKGNSVLIIDADLQDPPELMKPMYDKLQSGYDVVYGLRKSREAETLFKKASAFAFYRILEKLADVKIPKDTGDFRIMTRKVVDALLQMPERDCFTRGMVSWLGFNQTPYEYERKARSCGETKYPLRKMLRLAADALLSFSSKPLRLCSLFGAASAIASISLAAYIIVSYFLNKTVPGWASLGVIVTIFSSIQLFSIGLLGEYVSRIYVEGKRRPLYLVDTIEKHSSSPKGNLL
ncbi:glycosyltransferase family 2 protein [Pelagicoccus enzymogenes]|uniref:glycosyltransferase family 2 protein n=1 Tax=Pelagicoccus enzymogenes TaxID=2773457 RepID=UPI00280D8C8C|nr:glycosyltransferase family 2 protein [Pelagicoccus enzymogenes]MDQ8199115.1 glycosyltransferase family 2 protein [Pelagicoccus enzymogenes]